MKVMVEMGHPAHVHSFRHMIATLEKQGHEVRICAWRKDITLRLLGTFGLRYDELGSNTGSGLWRKLLLGGKGVSAMWYVARDFKPDLFVSRLSPVSGMVSRLCGKPHVAFADTDFSFLSNTVALPMTDVVITPSCFREDLGRKQIRVNSYKELAYLHPHYFTPDPSVLLSEGLTPDTPFAVVRFVSWQAAHDVGQGGFSQEGRVRLVRELAKCGRVLVSGEDGLDSEVREYAFKAEPHLIHHFLYYASICVTEGGTTASEAAVLGTPAVLMNTLIAGVQTELEERYGLVFNFHDRRNEDAAIAWALQVMTQSSSNRKEWRAKAARLVQDNVDVTQFMVKIILGLGADSLTEG